MNPAAARRLLLVSLVVSTLHVSMLLGSFSLAFAQGQEEQESTKRREVDRALVTQLKEEVPKLLAEHDVPGLSMTLIRDGEIVWSHAFGTRRSDENKPVTERTVFEAASMSKPLFAYAVLKLVEQGKLDLDRSLDSYLSEPYLPDQPDAAKITARMVLIHTTGFPNWRREQPLVLQSPPGTKYGYSGEGFLYLQRVVEHLTGEDLDRWINERLLAPLGMNRSSYVWQETFADDFAGGHDDAGKFKEERRLYSKANAAYTLYTTPEDYGRFLLEMIHPNYEQEYTLTPEMRREMLAEQPVPGNDQRRGLGWALAPPQSDSTPSGGFVYHSGSNGTGFRCYSRFHKTRSDGLVIMTNGVNGAAVWKAVLEIIDTTGDVEINDAVGEVPDDTWRTATRRQMDRWSLNELGKAEEYWKSLGSTAVMIVENGAVVRAWGDVERPIQCHSIRKSFLSVLFGIYEKKGQIDLSATLAKLEIDDVPQLTPDEKQATVRDLLTARSGIYHAAAYETQSMRDRRPERGSHPHGTFWYYNNWDFNALGGIFQQQTGLTVFAAFETDIADAIGMNDFSAQYTKFVYDRKSSRFPAYTFRMSTRDRARFGLLCLRNGKWSGKQLVPSNWLEESTHAYSKTGPGVGYGYMWWVSVDGWHLGNKFQGKPYSARGNHGQRIVVIPEMQLVAVQSVDKSAGDEIAKGKSFNKLLKLILAAKKK